MITPQAADQLIAKRIARFSMETVDLEHANGAIIAETVLADRDNPAFDRSLMDGIVISSQAWKKGARTFKISGLQAAGQAQKSIRSLNECYEIATGAVIPKGCDSVIPIEYVTIKNSTASVLPSAMIAKGQCIQRQGSFQKRTAVVLKKGSQLNSPQLAICASVGKPRVRIIRQPKVAILTTGDELVSINRKNIKPYQVRQSNALSMKIALESQLGASATIFHLKDERKQMLKVLKGILGEFDAFVSSGGVSMGKLDLVPAVFKELGMKVIFHKVSQKPGKPFWFGVTRTGKPVFALPGNPLSTQICLYRYVIAHLKSAMGKADSHECAVLSRDYHNKSRMSYFLPVKTFCNQSGRIMAQPVDFAGSGDAVSLANTDGFVELPKGLELYPQGAVVKLYRW